MKSYKYLTVSAAAALLLACGGEPEKTKFSSVVSFGDSYSDAGTYKGGTIGALGGGKFTVNGVSDKVWTEVISTALGTPAQCPAQTGFTPNNGVTGATVTNAANCFNYAQGSSRVTSVGSGPNGIALQAYGQQNLGFIADSIQNQLNRYLANSGGAYTATQLVTINGGGNDFFMQLNAVGAAAGGGAAAQGAATIAGWPPQTVTDVFAGGVSASQAAAGAAVTAMGQAGAEMATYIKTLVVGKGAKHVLVRNLGDLNLTPLGLGFDAGTKSLATAMVTAYNSQLLQGLNGTLGVVMMDDYVRGQAIAANPASVGHTNVTTPACGPNAFSPAGPPAPTFGPSIVCSTGSLIAGDTSKYAFSDDVHPTPYSHQVAADFAIAQMKKSGLVF